MRLSLPASSVRRRLTTLLLSAALATALSAHGPLHEQIAALTEELKQHPDDPTRLVRRGELLRLHGLLSEARLDFERVAALRPNDVTNDFRLGELDLDARETRSAVVRLERFATARPESLAGQLTVAKALGQAEQPRAAAAHFSAAIAISPEPRPEWFLSRARALQAADASVDEILRSLDEGISRCGPLPALQLLAVDLEVNRGRTEAALARLDALAARAERKERWLMRRGEVLLQAGRTNAARAEFIAAGRALDDLPDKLRRAWVATELRQQIDAKLATLPNATEAAGPTP